MLIRELDQNMKLVNSIDAVDGTEITLTMNTAYVGIGLYSPKLSNINQDTYRELFARGMVATFNPSEKPVTKEEPTKSFDDILIGLIENGEQTSVDVLKYNLKDSEALQFFEKLMREKYYLLYKCVPELSLSMTCDQNGNVKSVSLGNLSADNLGKYKKLAKAVEDALKQIQTGMSETEKALVLHDYLLAHTEHDYNEKDPGYQAYNALVNGSAICQGYADALQTLYHEAGLESVLVDGNDEHHAWILVKLDGSYYHIDPTWDDLQSNYRHFYFLRSDAQFKTPDKGDKHFSWTSEGNKSAASTKYDNWFIHEVTGNVVYYNGYWYYASGNTLKRAKIDGSSMSVVTTETEAVKVLSASSTGVQYQAGTVTKCYE